MMTTHQTRFALPVMWRMGLLLIAITFMVAFAIAPAAHATSEPKYSLFAWHITSTTDDHFATPQEYITHLKTDSLDLDQLLPLLPCGIETQLDGYLNVAASDALIGGKLYGPGNPTEPWPGGAYQSSYSRVLTTPDCVQPADELTPGSSEALDCASSSWVISNWHDTVTYVGDRTGYTAQPAVRTVDAPTTRPADTTDCPVVVQLTSSTSLADTNGISGEWVWAAAVAAVLLGLLALLWRPFRDATRKSPKVPAVLHPDFGVASSTIPSFPAPKSARSHVNTLEVDPWSHVRERDN